MSVESGPNHINTCHKSRTTVTYCNGVCHLLQWVWHGLVTKHSIKDLRIAPGVPCLCTPLVNNFRHRQSLQHIFYENIFFTKLLTSLPVSISITSWLQRSPYTRKRRSGENHVTVTWHLHTPGRSRNTSQRLQRNPSRWSSETADCASWNLHSGRENREK